MKDTTNSSIRFLSDEVALFREEERRIGIRMSDVVHRALKAYRRQRFGTLPTIDFSAPSELTFVVYGATPPVYGHGGMGTWMPSRLPSVITGYPGESV